MQSVYQNLFESFKIKGGYDFKIPSSFLFFLTNSYLITCFTKFDLKPSP